MAKVALVQGEEVKKPKVSLGTKIKKEWNRNKYVYALAIPLIAYYAIFHYGPMYGIVMAFQDYSIVDGISGSPFVEVR